MRDLEKVMDERNAGLSEGSDVAAYFEATACNWNAMYSRTDLWGDIHQQRLTRLLHWVDRLDLPAGAKAADVGCGAGLASVALAKRGFLVESTDVAASMIELTAQNAKSAGVSQCVRPQLGDIYRLEFPDQRFDLALSVGVIPWLSFPAKALAELGRVLKPGAFLLFTADNCRRLSHLLDPATSPYLDWPRRMVKAISSSKAPQPTKNVVRSNRTSLSTVDELLSAAGLVRIQSETLGFGPFTFFHKKILSERTGVTANRSFQRLADSGWPIFRSTGAQFLVLAQKLPAQPSDSGLESIHRR